MRYRHLIQEERYQISGKILDVGLHARLAILRTMDIWDPQRGCSSAAEAFGGIRARLSFVGISSDWLFPPQSVRDFAYTLRAAGVQADYREMTSAHGHDAFLAEQAELVRLLQ